MAGFLLNWYQPSLHSPQLHRERDAPRQRAGTYTNIFFLIFRLMKYTDVCFFSLLSDTYVCTTLAITSLCWKGSHLLQMLERKGMMPGTTYIRSWYVYQHFLFDFPFDEIYRRLLFFTLTRYVCTTRINSTAASLFVYSLVRMIPTFRPRTHTSDDSYIYQLSLVLATATVSFHYCVELRIALIY